MTPEQQEAERKRRQEDQKRKQEAGPQRIGRKKKKKGADTSSKLPTSKFVAVLYPSLPQLEVPPPSAPLAAREGLHPHGAGVHLEPRAAEASGPKERAGARNGGQDPRLAPRGGQPAGSD